MKVAITEYEGRIAPVFDTCQRILVFFESSDSRELVAEEDWCSIPRFRRPLRLRKLSIDLLICGGISRWLEEQILGCGMRLISWRSGYIDDILEALDKGLILDRRYAMPGRIGRTRHCCRRSWHGNTRATSQKGERRCQDLTRQDRPARAAAPAGGEVAAWEDRNKENLPPADE